MEAVKRARKSVRSSFTKSVNSILEELKKEQCDDEIIKTKAATLERLYTELDTLDRQILNQEFETDEKYEAEWASIETYKETMDSVRVKFETHFNRMSLPLNNATSVASSPTSTRRKLKLPKIELKQFGGEVKDWLTFWSQFKRIHDDDEIESEDKFHYLFQATIPGSRARDIVDSFPATAENYKNVIECLTNRFGREEILIEFYVREMLGLVIRNVQEKRGKSNVAILYDKLESYLRALETIGMTTDKYAAMLFPLVESCIPEDLFRVWLRNQSTVTLQEDSYSDKLKLLLLFLKNEVEGEQRISLAKLGFNLCEGGLRKGKKIYNEVLVPTANDLFSSETKFEKRNERNVCIFCEKHHDSKDCFEAPKMPLSKRHELIKNKRACFICFKIGHRAMQCKTKVHCIICSKRHWAIVCSELGNQNQVVEKVSKDDDEQPKVSLANSCVSGEVFLQTLLVNIEVNGRKRTVRALIDSGSQRSYLLKDTARKMGCRPVGSESLVHSLFGGVNSKRTTHNCYQLAVSSLDGKYSRRIQLLEQPKICGHVTRVPPELCSELLDQIHIVVTDLGKGDMPIEILLGADIAGQLLTDELYRLNNGLVAVQTLLGWVVMGKVAEYSSEENASSIVTNMLIHTNNIENLWKLEAIGITDSCEIQPVEEMEKAVLNHFHKTLRENIEGRYEVSLPWVNDKDNLPSNREIAEKRLISTTKKLKSGKRFEDYNAVFSEWLQLGIIEEVPESNLEKSVHYLPHRAVFKENSTTSVRPVFDASCKQKDSFSLNDCLAKGPNLLELIPTILFKFREKKIGIISDIKKAFLQISINDNDRDFLRFLWWKNSEQEMKEFRHCRVVFGLNCSPFLLGAVINFHLQHSESCSKTVAEKLRSSFYVDNCVTSVDSEEDAEIFISKATEIMAEAKFNLRGWEQTEMNGMKIETQPTKVLGLLWDKHEDLLFCDVQGIKLGELPLTRRTILSIVQKVFDPIGFVCPFTLLPKLCLQRSWEEKLSWDAELPEDLKRKFLKWMDELPLISTVKIPRFMTLDDSDSHSLHIFVDASKISYAVVVYLRSENKKQVKVQLLQAKSRVAPLKKSTIPRLELLACCIGARMASFINKNLGLKIARRYFWTDSSTALYWIKRNEPWGTFVNNRVKEIRNLTITENWNHIPGTENPADLPSRGCSAKKLIISRWWEGPSWLSLTEDEWPQSDPIENREEIIIERKGATITTLNCNTNVNSWITGYFSSYLKILRMVAWMLRFIWNSKRKGKRENGELKVSELAAAEKVLVRLIQQEAFTVEDIKKLKSISVFKDEEGLLRVKTKLTERKDLENFIYPMLLPKNHKLVEYLIIDTHLRMFHAGVHVLMTKLRETFWIIQTRKTIRKVLSHCIRCKRHEAKRIQSVPIALPEKRVRDASPFEVTGVDLAGPLILRNREKSWIILFTCAVYRAIHLELVLSLTTQSFLLGLRRFIARRGRPKVIYSDNGSNFVGSDKLFHVLNWQVIEAEAAIRRIQWIFNPPAAPWWGGFWERMIQMLKKLLRRVLGQSSLNYEELASVLCDCEAVVNSRPLTYVSEDSEDLIPLTPAMFLCETTEFGVPDLDQLDKVNLNKRFRHQQQLRDVLRERFRSEYLSQLVQESTEADGRRNVKLGDIVLIENDGKRRIFWPMGKVVEVYPGRDGNIRVVRVKTSSGEMVRPVQRIFPLEISSLSVDGDSRTSNSTADENKIPNNTDSSARLPEMREGTVCTRIGRTVKIPSRYLD